MTDKYVIFFTGRCGWSAVSISTGQTGYGYTPREAINNAIKAADQLTELTRESSPSATIEPASELISKLARIAQPLNCDDYNQGVVYSYERTIEGVESPQG